LTLSNFISNKILINPKKKYSAIIGINPSQGARSPKLWNRAYKKMNSETKMICLDVKKKNYLKLMNYLEKDKNFIGGAITNPYKEITYKYLKLNIDKTSLKIGSINCIYRKNGQLFGTNTDGEGAIHSLKKLGSIRNKNFLVLGTGGTSLSVSSYLTKYVNKNENLLLAGRKTSRLKLFKKKFNCSTCLIKDLIENIKKYDFVINCTDVGSINKKNQLILSNEHFQNFKSTVKIFDVIYDPIKTPFLKLADKNKKLNINGLDMNFYQAVYAFIKTNKIRKKDHNKVSTLMK
jgi:shikimate dehydrogenase